MAEQEDPSFLSANSRRSARIAAGCETSAIGGGKVQRDVLYDSISTQDPAIKTADVLLATNSTLGLGRSQSQSMSDTGSAASSSSCWPRCRWPSDPEKEGAATLAILQNASQEWSRGQANETLQPFAWDNLGAGNDPASIASNTVLGSLALSDWEGRPCVQDLHPTLSIVSRESSNAAPVKFGTLMVFAEICEDYGMQDAASSEHDASVCRVTDSQSMKLRGGIATQQLVEENEIPAPMVWTQKFITPAETKADLGKSVEQLRIPDVRSGAAGQEHLRSHAAALLRSDSLQPQSSLRHSPSTISVGDESVRSRDDDDVHACLVSLGLDGQEQESPSSDSTPRMAAPRRAQQTIQLDVTSSGACNVTDLPRASRTTTASSIPREHVQSAETAAWAAEETEEPSEMPQHGVDAALLEVPTPRVARQTGGNVEKRGGYSTNAALPGWQQEQQLKQPSPRSRLPRRWQLPQEEPSDVPQRSTLAPTPCILHHVARPALGASEEQPQSGCDPKATQPAWQQRQQEQQQYEQPTEQTPQRARLPQRWQGPKERMVEATSLRARLPQRWKPPQQSQQQELPTAQRPQLQEQASPRAQAPSRQRQVPQEQQLQTGDSTSALPPKKVIREGPEITRRKHFSDEVNHVSISEKQKQYRNRLDENERQLDNRNKILEDSNRQLFDKMDLRVKTLEARMNNLVPTVDKLKASMEMTEEYWKGRSHGLRELHKMVAMDKELIREQPRSTSARGKGLAALSTQAYVQRGSTSVKSEDVHSASAALASGRSPSAGRPASAGRYPIGLAR